MKKPILILLALLASGTFLRAQISWGPEAGLNGSNYISKLGGNTISTTAKLGVRVGGVVDMGLGNNLAFEPGLFYLMNGYKLSYAGATETANINTLEIPLNILFKIGEPGRGRFWFGLGPYLAFNLSGNVKVPGFNGGSSISESLKFGSTAGTDEMKSSDFGVGFNVGYQLADGLFLRAGYQKGVKNLVPGGNGNNSQTSSNFSVTVGYLFGSWKVRTVDYSKRYFK